MDLIVLVPFLAGSLGFGYAILEPISQAVKGREQSTRFATCDLFALGMMLAPPLTYLSVARTWHPGEWVTTVGGALVAVFLLAWWRGATVLSTLGIYDWHRRLLFLAIMLPVVLVGSAVGVPLTAIMTLAVLVEPHQHSQIAFWLWPAAAMSLLMLAIGLRGVSIWILAGVKSASEPAS